MNNLSKIKECMKNDPDIIRIGEKGENFLIDTSTRLYTKTASIAINLLKYMREKDIIFFEGRKKISILSKLK